MRLKSSQRADCRLTIDQDVSKSAQETSASRSSHRRLAMEMENGHVVQSQDSSPGPIPLSDVSTGAPHGETAAVTATDLHPNIFAGQPSVGTVTNNPNLTVDSYIVSRADDPTFVTSWQPQANHERSATDASGILSSEPRIDNMPSVSMNIYRPTSKTVCMAVQRGKFDNVNLYYQPLMESRRRHLCPRSTVPSCRCRDACRWIYARPASGHVSGSVQ